MIAEQTTPTDGQLYALKTAISISQRANVPTVDRALLRLAWLAIRKAERFPDCRALYYKEARSLYYRAHKGKFPPGGLA